MILAASAVYEIAEWVAAMTFAPDWADAYNGQQGDLWDAQRDMALAWRGSMVECGNNGNLGPSKATSCKLARSASRGLSSMSELTPFRCDRRQPNGGRRRKAGHARLARASGVVRMSAETLALIRDKRAAKGDVLEVARLAGIMAAKRTAELIPLCHPLPLESVTIDFDFADEQTLRSMRQSRSKPKPASRWRRSQPFPSRRSPSTTCAKASTAASSIGPIQLEEKSGGRSGQLDCDPQSEVRQSLALKQPQFFRLRRFSAGLFWRRLNRVGLASTIKYRGQCRCPWMLRRLSKNYWQFVASLERWRPSTNLSPGGMHPCGNTSDEWRIKTSWPTS